MLKRTRITFVFLLAAGTIFYTSCKKFGVEALETGRTPTLPEIPYDYLTVQTPNGTFELTSFANLGSGQHGSFPFFGDPGVTYLNNNSVALGRVLFYDTRLSINNTVACASCHNQQMGFADGLKSSSGFADKITSRNSMAIINPITQGNLFWDSRAESSFDLSLRPVFNHIEMGMESDEMLIKKISQASFYPELFEKAFGNNEVSRWRIAAAISHFLNSMISFNAKFDEAGTNNFQNFTAMEKLGKDLFFSERLNCAACHNGQNFSAAAVQGSPYSMPTVKGTANIGLDIIYTDNGKEKGKFRIPGLRNIELTGPYMHDGRFATLEEVIEHYNSGIKAHPELDENLMEDGLPKRLHLTPLEKAAVIAFLKTLTDKSFTTDKRYSDPFKN